MPLLKAFLVICCTAVIPMVAFHTHASGSSLELHQLHCCTLAHCPLLQLIEADEACLSMHGRWAMYITKAYRAAKRRANVDPPVVVPCACSLGNDGTTVSVELDMPAGTGGTKKDVHSFKVPSSLALVSAGSQPQWFPYRLLANVQDWLHAITRIALPNPI